MKPIESEILATHFEGQLETTIFPANLSRQLQSTLEHIRLHLRLLGINPHASEIATPPFLLSHPLAQRGKQMLDETLGSVYARKNVDLQSVIARVPIAESYEPLIFLPDFLATHHLFATYSDLPFNPACGDWANRPRVFWVRQSFARLLLPAISALNSVGLYPHIEDAFRPVGVQEGLFRRRIKWILDAHPDWNTDQILTEAQSKTAVTPRLATHKAGAALDLTLRHLDTREPLDLGNTYPEGGPLVAIDCPFVTPQAWYTRQLFANWATHSGFALYPAEDWHISYDDNLHNHASLTPTPYGPIREFSRETGEILSIYTEPELDTPFFDQETIDLLQNR